MKNNPKVLVVATSRKTRGGITSVVKAYESSPLWNDFQCKWIETHRDGGAFTKIMYLIKGFLQFLVWVSFYDIVHIHTSEPASALRKMPFMVISRLLGKKVIVHFHSFSVETTINSKYQWVYRYLFGKADCVLVLSKYWQDELNKTFGFSADKVKVLYNPCTTEVSEKVYPKKKEILYAGTVNARKGYADMIKAFAKIADKYRDWSIVFAGNGEIEEGKALAQHLGIAGQTVFLGWVRGDDKDKTFKEASAFCLPSYAEGFPMGVLDAWAYGLPVITTPVGGIPDIAEDGKNCLLFNPGDVEKLAVQMDKMLESESLRKDIAAESSKLAQGIFSIDVVTRNLGGIYQRFFFHMNNAPYEPQHIANG